MAYVGAQTGTAGFRLIHAHHVSCPAIAPAAGRVARADLRITRDYGGYVTEYKAKYERVRDRKERVIIDGICNSACTLVFGIVPMSDLRHAESEPRFPPGLLRQGLHLRHQGHQRGGHLRPDVLLSDTVKDWIRSGGLTPEMKKIKNGEDLWKIVDPCPEEF